MNAPPPNSASLRPPRLALAVLTPLLSMPAWAQNFEPITFVDRSDMNFSFTHGAQGFGDMTGVAWFDSNNDGLLDYFVSNVPGTADGLMGNTGAAFLNVSSLVGLDDLNGSAGVAAGDLDNDGWTDLVVSGAALSAQAIRIYKNIGGQFVDVTSSSGVVLQAGIGENGQPSLGDINNDGLVDLFVAAIGSLNLGLQPANHLFLNTGSFTFTDVSVGSNVDSANGACTGSFTHYNDDEFIDLIVANCNDVTLAPTPIQLFVNNGDISFTDVTDSVGLNTDELDGRGYWMCVGLNDFDNDGDFDLFCTNSGGGQRHGFFEQATDGTFLAVEQAIGLGAIPQTFGWGCSIADFNNDGWEDLFFAGGMPSFGKIGPTGNPGTLLMNKGDKTFEPVTLPLDMKDRFATGVATADFDNDGDADVLVGLSSYYAKTAETPLILRNASTNGNRSLTVKLIGTSSNRSAIGARVVAELSGRRLSKEVRAGSSFLSQDSLWLTFGMNQSRLVHKLIVYWPSGAVETFDGVKSGVATITEGVGLLHE